MSRFFAELSRHETPAGIVTLRRRLEPRTGGDVYEVKLGDEFLMSSLFIAGEVALADLGLAAVPADQTDLHIVVGGLGLGYTAQAALRDPRVASMVVVEAVETVIGWHNDDLLPDVAGMAADPRTTLHHADFFAATGTTGYDPEDPERRFDAILLDVDHTPRHLLHPSHAPFYTPEGLVALRSHLVDGGVFALWSDDPPDEDFMVILRGAFDTADAHVVDFPNAFTGGTSSNTVYVAT